MTLWDWLARDENESCDDEQRVILAINIANLTGQCSDGHLNPERIDVADDLSVSLNNNSNVQDEYAAPEILRDEGAKGFVSAVFSYGVILDELLRGSSYVTEKSWTTEEFLRHIETAEEWFEPFENSDPLEDVLRPCLATDPSKRPQTFEELKNLLSRNSDVANFLKSNPQYSWTESQTEDNSAPTEPQHSEETKQTDEDSDAGLAIGIDLGTSNSTVAYYKSGKYKYIEVSNKRLIPSAIYFKESDPEKWIYGDRALRRGIMYPDSLFKHFKRRIGENAAVKFHVEPSADVKTDKRKYIIDTNIFIEDPNILDGFDEDVEIFVPKTVYQELERRKSDSKTADEAAVALESINKYEGKLVTLADSHPELLPDDVFKSADKNNNDRNDSKILSVALFHDGERTVLLSNDKNIPVKAEWVTHKFIVQNYNQFSFIRHTVEDSESPGELNLTGKDGAAFFLKYLRELVRKDIGYVSKAVITVPEKFSPIQRNEIKDAGFKAGFTEIELHSEPHAAALAYGLEQEGDKNILIYDFGGGTFDITIFNMNNGRFDPLSSGGDDKLGGEDFTQALITDFMEKLQQGEILPNDEELDMFDEDASGLSHDEFGKNNIKIWEACEGLKCSLSSSEEETKKIQLYVKPGERKEVLYKLSREEFDDIISDLLAKSRKALDETLKNAGLKRNDIDVVIMAGGTSSIPVISEMVERYFGKKPYADRDPATLIAEGAALFADIKWNQDSTIDKKIKIFDRTMTDLGVSLKGRNFDVIIPVKSALPIKKEKIYSLVKDNQSELDIEFFTRDEGSNATRTMDDSIRYIGHVIIANLPPLKISEVDVCVTFSLTKEYELLTSAVLKDKQGKVIDQADVTIDTIGV